MKIAWMFTLKRGGEFVAQSYDIKSLDRIVEALWQLEGRIALEEWEISGAFVEVSRQVITKLAMTPSTEGMAKKPKIGKYDDDPNIQ